MKNTMLPLNATFIAANGQRVSFDTVVKTIINKVERYGKTKGWIMSDENLEDICQEAIVKAWNNRYVFDPRKGTLEAWAAKIAQNSITDKFKSEVRHRENERSFNTRYDDDGELIDELDSIEDFGQRTEYQAEGNEFREFFLDVTEKWPEVRRKIFLLTIKGYKPQEIAKVLGMTPNAVSIQLNRGREILKKAGIKPAFRKRKA